MQRGQRDDGNAAVEAAILYPLVLLLVLAVFQIAVYYHARSAVYSAAVGGAVAGAVKGGSAEQARAETQARIDAAGGAALLEGATVTATRTGEQVTVTVDGEAVTFVPGLPQLTVSKTVSAPVERFTAP